ncbi:MAG: hypothetical protein WCF90_03540 [Methanomicrobiales archaeon]
MITQDIVRRLWDEGGYENLALWKNDTITVVTPDTVEKPEEKPPWSS